MRIPSRRFRPAASKMLAVALLLMLAPLSATAEPLRIGSKAFTESVLLGEIARLTLMENGHEAGHQRQLGGSRILFNALIADELDVYAEYTGTLALELLAEDTGGRAVDRATLNQLLAQRGLGMSVPLGFDNSYAMGMRRAHAARLGIVRISDLEAHPDLSMGFSNEFMDRADGWPALRRVYGFPHQDVRGLNHDLAYRAIQSRAIDVIDVYTTDAEIAYYDLTVLEDGRDHFPKYEAVWLYRLDLPTSARAALDALTGTLDAKTMRRLNGEVKLEGRGDTEVAAEWLGIEQTDPVASITQTLIRTTVEHLAIVLVSLGGAILVAIPLGILAARMRSLGQAVLGLTGILQTVPSLAMFVFMIPLFGIGWAAAVAALFVYSLLPIVRNTHSGLTGIDPALRESALVLGLSGRDRLLRIELPLAASSILAGIKTAAVINVGTTTLAALIGAGGYGQPILTGIRLDDMNLIMQGAIPAAVLALLIQWSFDGLERLCTPRGLQG